MSTPSCVYMCTRRRAPRSAQVPRIYSFTCDNLWRERSPESSYLKVNHCWILCRSLNAMYRYTQDAQIYTSCTRRLHFYKVNSYMINSGEWTSAMGNFLYKRVNPCSILRRSLDTTFELLHQRSTLAQITELLLYIGNFKWRAPVRQKLSHGERTFVRIHHI